MATPAVPHHPSPLHQLERIGQSVWLDYIHRGMLAPNRTGSGLASGELKGLIEECGLRGLTSNPTIFEQAVAGSADYDAAIAALARAGRSAERISEALVVQDIVAAADLFRPIYDMSGGTDGLVSLEVSPTLARDAEQTVLEARRLWSLVNRPNLLIKVPGTPEGIPAVETLIAEGISVNITLLFSLDAYREVTEAYLRGLERRASGGEPLDGVNSVASFFVSRVDTEVDRRIEARLETAADSAEADRLRALFGTIAVANAKLAYERFVEVFSGPRFRALMAKGARVQRPLWASTSTKNPSYPDTMYVDRLIGPDSVNTMPLPTLRAFDDHGSAARTVDRDLDDARRQCAELEALGISLKAVTDQLVAEGVKKFADSYHALIARVEAKRAAVAARLPSGPVDRRRDFDARVEERLASAEAAELARRLWRRDVTLWAGEGRAREVIAQRLGWLDVAETMQAAAGDFGAFADEVRAASFERTVLIGMGGSSLAAAVFASALGPAPGFPPLTVLDTVVPEAVRSADAAGDPTRTLFVVSSKSGTTAEVSDLFLYFWQRVSEKVGAEAGSRFVAITDPGTPLADLAAERGFRRRFLAPSDVGGRYSALTPFGLVPAALIGVDLAALLGRARSMAAACGADVAAAANPGLRLGALLAEAALAGRDKITLVCSPALAGFGAWVEQLLAESTGKDGRGLVPIEGEPAAEPEAYGADRLFVSVALEAEAGAAAARLDALEAAGHPVLRFELDEPLAVGAEMFRWEFATSVAGALLGVNPFDQPNVSESKANTDRVLRETAGAGAPPPEAGAVPLDKLAGALGGWRATLGRGDYVAVLAYLAPTEGRDAALRELQGLLRDRLGVATTINYGPRYLHSTGQLHKGGPSTGAFLVLTADDDPDLPIPGAEYTFGQLLLAQALGDVRALERRGRRLARVHLRDADQGLAALRDALAGALSAAG